MRKWATLLTAMLLAAPFAGCGQDAPTAEEFCADHGGIEAGTVEADGDATCADGTAYEAEEESSSKKRKRGRR